MFPLYITFDICDIKSNSEVRTILTKIRENFVLMCKVSIMEVNGISGGAYNCSGGSRGRTWRATPEGTDSFVLTYKFYET